MPGKPRMHSLAVVLGGLAISVTAVASVLAQSDVFGAAVAVKDTGIFGLTEGRVARVDAVNLGGRASDVHLELLDDAGNMLADKFVMLEPGQAGAVEFLAKGGKEQKGRMNIRAHASVLDRSKEGVATRCGRNIRVSAVIFSPDTGQTLRKLRVFHRDMGVCADRGKKAAPPPQR